MQSVEQISQAKNTQRLPAITQTRFPILRLIHVRRCLATMLTDAVSCGRLSLNPILEYQRKANSKHRPDTVDPARPFTENEKARFQDAIRRLRSTGWRLRPSYAVHSVTRLRNSRPATLSRSSKSQENRNARMWEKTARGGSG